MHWQSTRQLLRAKPIGIWTIIVLGHWLLLSGERSVSYADEGKKYLIIHADDAGMSHSVNRATIDAMQTGVVSSASIMVPCPWFPEFAAHAKEHPDQDFGIHLTLNSEWKHYRWGPVTPRDQVPSLVDPDGYLWSNIQQVAANVKADEVDRELRAQVDRALQFGVPLTHLDTHMGAVITRPDLLEIYVNLGIDYNLPVMFVRTFGPQAAKEYPALLEKSDEMVRVLDRHGLPVLNGLAQFYGGESHEERQGNYLRTIRDLAPGVSQLIIHCGYDDDELQHITSSSARRDGDRRIFTDPDVMAEIEKAGVTVITWKQFREMNERPARTAD
ncbi:MAG: polysaccharide deacetylase family protein [Planctomycetaceae bacterium]|nr:polysaccharide deacetylase family protein [Planctomycetaceae bacterium]